MLWSGPLLFKPRLNLNIPVQDLMLPPENFNLSIDDFATTDDNIDDAWYCQGKSGAFESSHVDFCAA
jgi:hypothetical protein